MADDIGARTSDWLDIIWRARLGRGMKTVAFYLAHRADNDGTRIFPGIARTAVECEISYATARAALAALRKAGLIERVRQGNRRLHKADEYRLILAIDIDVPSPEAHAKAIEDVNGHNREQVKARPSALVQDGADEESRRDASALSQDGADGLICAISDPSSALATDRPTLIEQLPKEQELRAARGAVDSLRDRPDDHPTRPLHGQRPIRDRLAEHIIKIADENFHERDGITHDDKVTGALDLAALLIAEAEERGNPIHNPKAYLDAIGPDALRAVWQRAVDNCWMSTSDMVWDFDGTRYTPNNHERAA